jgi:hypothetical protein
VPRKPATAKAFNARAFVASAPQSHAGRGGCGTCRKTAVVKAVREILEAMADSGKYISVRQILDAMRAQFGYDLKHEALRSHIQRCEQGLYEKAYGPH